MLCDYVFMFDYLGLELLVLFAEMFQIGGQFMNKLVNDSVLLLLLQERLRYFLQVMNPTFLFDLFKALLYFFHAFPVQLGNSNFLLILVHQILNPQLHNGLSIRSLGCLLRGCVFQILLDQTLVLFEHLDIFQVLVIELLVLVAHFQNLLLGFLDSTPFHFYVVVHAQNRRIQFFYFIVQQSECFLLVFLLLPQLVDFILERIVLRKRVVVGNDPFLQTYFQAFDFCIQVGDFYLILPGLHLLQVRHLILIVFQNLSMVLLCSEQLSLFFFELARVRLDLFLQHVALVFDVSSSVGESGLIQILIVLAESSSVHNRKLRLKLLNKITMINNSNMYSQAHKSINDSNKQNRLTLEKRLSLRVNDSMQLKQTSRMSIPARRESIITAFNASQLRQTPQRNMRQSRPSLTSCHLLQNTQPARKSTILTNLVKKLDHEQELKQIISSKIKYKNQIIYSLAAESNENFDFKLSNCEDELRSCKLLVKNLMQKISQLQHGQSSKISRVKMVQCATQTQQTSGQKDNSIDFMDNLDKTLKILSGAKNK